MMAVQQASWTFPFSHWFVFLYVFLMKVILPSKDDNSTIIQFKTTAYFPFSHTKLQMPYMDRISIAPFKFHHRFQHSSHNPFSPNMTEPLFHSRHSSHPKLEHPRRPCDGHNVHLSLARLFNAQTRPPRTLSPSSTSYSIISSSTSSSTRCRSRSVNDSNGSIIIASHVRFDSLRVMHVHMVHMVVPPKRAGELATACAICGAPQWPVATAGRRRRRHRRTLPPLPHGVTRQQQPAERRRYGSSKQPASKQAAAAAAADARPTSVAASCGGGGGGCGGDVAHRTRRSHICLPTTIIMNKPCVLAAHACPFMR